MLWCNEREFSTRVVRGGLVLRYLHFIRVFILNCTYTICVITVDDEELCECEYVSHVYTDHV